MAKVASDVILIWAGTHSNIPSGYVRETSLDGRYAKGTADATNPGTTGGSATHSHNATTSHSHTESNHTHSITLELTTDYAGRGSGGDVWQQHSHAQHSSGNIVGGGLSSVSATYSSVSNDPPYYSVIFIKSLGTHAVPNDVIALFDYDKSRLPTNWYSCDGNNGTPNLYNRYLKGADTGSDSGSTGGSTTNTHILEHTHTVSSHSHSAVTSPSATPPYALDGWGGVTSGKHVGSSTHTHSTSLNATTPVLNDTVSLVTAETVEPAHTKLMAIQNKTGQHDLPIGIIGLWINALANIPKGWVLCNGQDGTIDMRSRYLKIGSSTEVGNTGGSNTHSHAQQSHSHTSNTHNHSATSSAHPPYNNFEGSPYYTSALGILASTVHPVTVGYAQSTFNSAETAADLQNNEPLYTTVAFIKYVGGLSGGSFLLNMLND